MQLRLAVGPTLDSVDIILNVGRVSLTVTKQRELTKLLILDTVIRVEAILQITQGRGADVAIEALGQQETFEAELRVFRTGGGLSSLGVYSSDLKIRLDTFAAGLGDHARRSTLCPGRKELMLRLVNIIAAGRFDASRLVTHRYRLDDIEKAYKWFA